MDAAIKFGTLWIALDLTVIATFWYIKSTFPKWWKAAVCDYAPENLD